MKTVRGSFVKRPRKLFWISHARSRATPNSRRSIARQRISRSGGALSLSHQLATRDRPKSVRLCSTSLLILRIGTTPPFANTSTAAARSRRRRTRRSEARPERARSSWTRLRAAARFRLRRCAWARTIQCEGPGCGAEVTFGETKVERHGETVLDRIHQSMILFAAGRAEALRRFLVEDGIGRDTRFWRLAQALSALYPSHTEEKRWVDGVLARKKGFGF